MLNIRQLRAFAAVMLAGSVTGAATRLRISQPAISALIAGLERDLGFSLFLRDRNRLQPTSEAASFYRSVAAVLERLDGLERLATDIRQADEGTLRIAALPMLALEFDGCAIQRGEMLQPLCGNDVIATVTASTVGVQHGHTAAISMLELGQAAAGVQPQDPVQIEEIGLAAHASPPDTRWAGRLRPGPQPQHAAFPAGNFTQAD